MTLTNKMLSNRIFVITYQLALATYQRIHEVIRLSSYIHSF